MKIEKIYAANEAQQVNNILNKKLVKVEKLLHNNNPQSNLHKYKNTSPLKQKFSNLF